MSITVVGVNHRTAPLEVRERLYWPAGEVAGVLREVTSSGAHAVLLSTCNRTEFYLADAVRDTMDIIWELARKRIRQPLDPYVYVLREREAVVHLFRVAAGLDSMVLGESQIQGQVREAWELARHCAGPVLSRLFQNALTAGGRVRAETALGAGAASVPAASVEVARKIFGDLAGRRALILGSGEMAELAMSCLASEGVRSVMVAHRQLERAMEVAQRLGGRAVSFEEAWPLFAEVDLVVASTAAPHAVVQREQVAEHVARRDGRPLCILDIAVPRDVDPSVGSLENVFLYDIDDLQGVVAAGVGRRRSEIPAAERIVEQEAGYFWSWYTGRGALDIIRALRERAEEVRLSELGHAMKKLRGLSNEEAAIVDHLTRAIVNKLLHLPTRKLKEAAGDGMARDLGEAVRVLFGLEAGSGGGSESKDQSEEKGAF
ncbi:Glutamyl-tRNA reductase [bacterium HR33]|nr:Glutamyl-tRNA reductase [bacterium HR33]